ncbi:hypothetical protein DZC31_16600 [Stenotrophomonas rhizophila]|nr:hypothetical protein DZC31_16600 [Stenotrophomonas rhizophila]
MPTKMHRHTPVGFHRDASPCQQGGPCWRHRRDWPETDVGAGLPAMRRAGGARSHSPTHPKPSQAKH